MPQVTVYIRKADLPKWEAVEKKSEFIHNALELGENIIIKRDFISTEPESLNAKKLHPDIISKAIDLDVPVKPVTYKKTQNWGA